jgi:two-component system, sensor histidine kinase LadS
MRLPHIFLLFGLLMLASFPGPAWAASPLVLDEGWARIELNAHLQYFSGPLLAEDVHTAFRLPDSAFTQHSDEMPNFGFTQDRYWFRTLLLQPGSDENWLLELRYPPLDHIDVFLLDTDGEVLQAAHGGDRRPFASRGIRNRHFTALLPVPLNEPVWLYIRVQTDGSLQLPAVLTRPEQFVADSRNEQYLLGLYYGILLSMLLYNLLIYISIRDSSYLYYIFYIGSYSLFQMTLNGLAFEYLWPEATAWNNRALPFLIAVSMFALMLLTRTFLRTESSASSMDRLLKFTFLALVLTAFACLVMPYNPSIRLASAVGVIGPIVVFCVGANSLFRGYRQARFFLLAFSALLVGMAMYALKTFHLLPGNVVTENGLQIGSALQMILLAFALADRMRLLKEANVKIEQEARQRLEQRVEERTRELNGVLGELEGKNRLLSELNTIDGLTGVRNRAYQDQLLVSEWSRAFRHKRPISVLMVDIDHFKAINDNYGHQAGDAALRQVAQIIQSHLKRPTDVVCRYGGEEFMVILPETPAEGACVLAESIRKALADTEINTGNGTIRLTVSIGVGSCVPASSNEQAIAGVIGLADAALYAAKTGGRNQVRLGDEGAENSGSRASK